jgi:glutathione S-transferase
LCPELSERLHVQQSSDQFYSQLYKLSNFTMPSYKLKYFKVRGRAQAIKYLCIDNGIALEEEIVEMGDWAKVKPTTIFGQLPVFFDGDFEIAQSNAILRHLARKHGLYGKDETEATKIDMINDTQEDLRLTYVKFIYQQYETEKDKETYVASLPDKLALFEKALGRNKGGHGFFVGSKVSFADYNLFDLLDNLITLSPHVLDSFPLLKAFHGHFATNEKLAKYRMTDSFTKTPINGNGKQ